MEIKGRLTDLKFDFATGEAVISFSTKADKRNLALAYEELEEYELDIKFDKHREKRSLNANNYAWALMSKIADKLCTTKEMIYAHFLRESNFFEEDDDGMPISVVANPKIDMSATGHWCFIGWSGNNKIWLLMKGSSEYNTYQMSKFIGSIVNEAKELGIETLTPRELAQMLSNWK